MIRSSTFGHRIAIGVASAIAMLGFMLSFTSIASAHQDPAACNASGLQQFPSIVSPAGNAYDGSTITYSVIYANIDPDGAGPVAPCNITLADATINLPGGGVVNVLTDATLNVGDTISCPGDPECAAGPYTYVVNHANESGGSVTAQFNIAGVLHQDADEEAASDQDTLSKTVIHPSTILSITSASSTVAAGGSVMLTITEQNDGGVPLTSPSVTVDNGVGTLSAPPTSGDTGGDNILGVGETWSWTVSSGAISSSTTFTATGTGLDPNGNSVTFCSDPQNAPALTICDQDERDSVAITLVSPLVIEKTASATFDRKYNWTIDKSANQTNINLDEDATTTVHYTVTVDDTFVDMNASVTGNITITNPGGNPTATITGVTDVLSDDAGPVDVVCPGVFPQQLAAGASLVCTYSEDLTSPLDQTNTATVTTSGSVPGGSDSANVDFTSPANLIDECIVVDDTYTGGPQDTVICFDDLDAEKTLHYSITFGPEGVVGVNIPVVCDANTHPNTASFTTQDDANDTDAIGSDSHTVNITVECVQGCTLTQGYWKTHSSYGPAAKPDANWASVGGPDTAFFSSGKTWIQVFNTAPKGNAYYNLAHQYMAAVLNSNTGAGVPANVQDAIDDATTLFSTYTPAQVNAWKGNQGERQMFLSLAGTLGSYNEGAIGPGHCD